MVPRASPPSVAAPPGPSPPGGDAAGPVSTAPAAGPARRVIHDLPRPSRVRSPSDVVRLVGALVLVLAGHVGAIPYWLVMLPGWISFNVMHKRGEI